MNIDKQIHDSWWKQYWITIDSCDHWTIKTLAAELSREQCELPWGDNELKVAQLARLAELLKQEIRDHGFKDAIRRLRNAN